MDLNAFNNNEEIILYLKESIKNITILNECRLTKKEQLYVSEDVIHFRNCIEWIIRSNQVISNIKYALTKCLEFAQSML